MTERREEPASIHRGDAGQAAAVEREGAEAPAATELGESLEAFRTALARAGAVEVPGLQAVFEGLGVRIGRMVAEQIRGGNTPRVEELVVSTVQSAEVVELLSAAVLSMDGLGAPAAAGGARPALQPGRPGRRRKRGEPPPPCGSFGCGRPSRTRGFCQTHYVQWLRANRASPP